MSQVAIVVPCHNEERRLRIDAFRELTLPNARVLFVFVDDGSTDGTRALIEGLARAEPERFACVVLDENRGKAEAVRRGVLDALARDVDFIGYWDADLSTPLDELAGFVDLLQRSPQTDLVFGARVLLMGRAIERFALRHYAGRIFATAASQMLDLPIYDTQCGAKVFRVNETLQKVFAEPFIVNWTFDVEIIARYIRTHPEGIAYVRRALVELPLQRWTDVPGSKVKPTDFGRAFYELWQIRQRHLGRSDRS